MHLQRWIMSRLGQQCLGFVVTLISANQIKAPGKDPPDCNRLLLLTNNVTHSASAGDI